MANESSQILLAHGGGGRLMHELIERVILPVFKNDLLETRHDGAVLDVGGVRIAFTTDSYVVRPLFFPGGDIGSLAVNGTVNDLAMCGARPLALSAGLIVEEGFPMETLRRVMESMRRAADAAGVHIVTGDTKVVDKGKGDGLYINTAGVGVVEQDRVIAPSQVRSGDAIVVSGDIGRHGVAIMAVREGIGFEGEIESDCAPLAEPVRKLFDAGVRIHCLRDLTRGGLTSALNEIAEAAKVGVEIDESAVPVCEAVRGACEMLGMDPLSVANEGRFVAFVDQADAENALQSLRSHPLGRSASVIGLVGGERAGRVVLRGNLGGKRILDMPAGEQLPRIC